MYALNNLLDVDEKMLVSRRQLREGMGLCVRHDNTKLSEILQRPRDALNLVVPLLQLEQG